MSFMFKLPSKVSRRVHQSREEINDAAQYEPVGEPTEMCCNTVIPSLTFFVNISKFKSNYKKIYNSNSTNHIEL